MKFTKNISPTILSLILMVAGATFCLEDLKPYSSSKVSIGVNYYLSNIATTKFDDETTESNGDKTSIVSPWIGFRRSSLFEIRPAINLMYSIKKSSISDSSGNESEKKISQYGLGLELGFHFYLIERGIFSFSVGPSIPINFTLPEVTRVDGEKEDDSQKYFDMDVGINAPINFNFTPGKHIGFKAGLTVLRFNLNFLVQGPDDNTVFTLGRTTSNALTHFLDEFALSIFLYF